MKLLGLRLTVQMFKFVITNLLKVIIWVVVSITVEITRPWPKLNKLVDNKLVAVVLLSLRNLSEVQVLLMLMMELGVTN